MNDSSPPRYSSAIATAPALLVNLAPPPEATSFQLGYLGHGPAFVAGEVQVKYTGPADHDRPACTRLEVCFSGVERGPHPGDHPIDLFEQRKVLWGEGAAGASSTSSSHRPSASAASFPPSSTPFKLELTPDLPVCIHTTPSSSLTYTLTAILYYADPDALPLVRCAPVHLLRTTPPGAPLSTLPHTLAKTSPLAFSVRLPRTTFRRSEPIELMTRIEVPSAKAVGQGLRLRTVSAELVRTIQVVGVSHSVPSSADGREDVAAGPAKPVVGPPQVHRTVLAHSGKSARFSPSRPIIIRLVLHPPTEPSCESITQSTILHTVSFSVVVVIGLVNVSPTSHTGVPSPDAVLSQDVFILPDTPAARTDKQKEVERADPYAALSPGAEPWAQQDAPVPTYVENSEHDSGEPLPASGSSSAAVTWAARSSSSTSALGLLDDVPYAAVYPTDGDEEEYDGYEEISLPATLSTRAPPPAIDEDVSPPSVGEPSSVAGLALATAQGGVIDASELDGDSGPPPPDDFAYAHGAVEAGTPPPDIDSSPLPVPLRALLASASAAVVVAPTAPEQFHPRRPRSPPPPLSPLGSSALELGGADYLLPARGAAHRGPSPAASASASASPPPPLSPLPSPGEGERGLPPPPYFTGGAAPPALSSSPLPPPPSPPPPPPPPPCRPRPPPHGARPRGSSAADRGYTAAPPELANLSASSTPSPSSSPTPSSPSSSTTSPGPLSSSRSAGAFREGAAADEQGAGPGYADADARPPPYEQREPDDDDRVQLVRYGVNRRGELVL
ncbi:hypothetical protein JCM3770_002606 [Rhodotorula araucariae]